MMRLNCNKFAAAGGGIMLGAALLWLACRGINLRALAAVAAAANPWPLILIPFTVAGELAIRGIKWSLLLRPAGRVRPWDAGRLEAAALALNNVLPLRLGELARAAYGAELFDISILTIAATIAAEKLLDMAALLTLALLAAGAGAFGAGLAAHWPRLAAGAALVTLALLAAFKLAAGRPRLAQALGRLGLGLKTLGSPRTAAAAFCLALLQWGLNALNYYWAALALGLGAALKPARCALLSFTGAAGSSVPGMPGYFGSFELAVAAAARGWGVGPEAALALAALAHLLPYLATTAAGLFFLYQLGRPLGAIWQRFSACKPANEESKVNVI